MKILGLFLLATMLQSCNRPIPIPLQDSSGNAAKKGDVDTGLFQRFLPVAGTPSLALDSVTGQLCRTAANLGGSKGEDSRYESMPFCHDLWMATNAAVANAEAQRAADKNSK